MDKYLPSGLARYLSTSSTQSPISSSTSSALQATNATVDPLQWDLPTLAATIIAMKPLLPTYLHLLVSALLPIYAGAHASLSRPSSAAKSSKKHKDPLSDDDSDPDDSPHRMESLTAADAVAFPLVAGLTLTSLYFLIKWLQDPAILNRILNLYFAGFSVFAVARLVSDVLDVAHSLAFPRVYRDQGYLLRVDTRKQRVVSLDASLPSSRTTPLPGPLSRLPLLHRATQLLWFLKTAPRRPFRVQLHLLRTLQLDTALQIHNLEGLLAGVATVAYYNLIAKPWPLTNLMGFGFAYGALQLLSPSTFGIATALLSALFCYDVYMVFFTPMMVAVAKGLDVPVKMEFPRAEGMAMLGLGDIVLPGIVVGLGIRFDLWVEYLRRQQRGEESEKGESEAVKAPYVSVTGNWGSRFWTSRWVYPLTGWPRQRQADGSALPAEFPKTYFRAAMVGYVLGMLATLLAMQISDHPQPALLYLVPGVLGAVWLTAVLRGEVKEIWSYSELEEEEKRDGEKEKKSKEGKERGVVWAEYFGLPVPKREVEKDKEGEREDTEGVSEESKGSTRNDKKKEQKEKPKWFKFKFEFPPPLPGPEQMGNDERTSGDEEKKEQ